MPRRNAATEDERDSYPIAIHDEPGDDEVEPKRIEMPLKAC
jgi:hypothetical protein